MSDETKTQSAIKFIDHFKGLAVAVGLALMVDQGKFFGETVPAIWGELKRDGTIALQTAEIAFKEHAIPWFKANWKRLKWVSLIWWFIAIAFLATGTFAKSVWPEGLTLALRITGVYILAAYWYMAAVCAKPVYLGWSLVKRAASVTTSVAIGNASHLASKVGLNIPVMTLAPSDVLKIEATVTSIQRFFYTLACITLLFGTFFVPNGEVGTAVKLAYLGIPLAFMAAVAAKHGWLTVTGWKLLNGAVLIAFLVMTFMMFGKDLVPASVRNWVSKVTSASPKSEPAKDMKEFGQAEAPLSPTQPTQRHPGAGYASVSDTSPSSIPRTAASAQPMIKAHAARTYIRLPEKVEPVEYRSVGQAGHVLFDNDD